MSFWKRKNPVDEANERLEQRVKELEKTVHSLENTVKMLTDTQSAKQTPEETLENSQPLDGKVKALEETLETLKGMRMSDQMAEFIRKKERTLKMASLINSVSEKPALDFSKEEASIAHIKEAKKSIDDQIKLAMRNAGTFSDDYPDDPRYFTYEIESGMITRGQDETVKSYELTSLVGKGIRITGYNGFDTERIVVPKEIDGLPVVTIGEKAFKNASFSELILPKTIKALLREAFSGCTNLKHIDLPEELAYIKGNCFQSSGLEEIILPNSLKEVAYGCFSICKNLTNVILGSNVTKISDDVFHGCSKLKSISLPESLQEIGRRIFMDTAISTLIIPQGVRTVPHDLFYFGGSFCGRRVTCVFLGSETEVTVKKNESFSGVNMICCLPGSAVQNMQENIKFQ